MNCFLPQNQINDISKSKIASECASLRVSSFNTEILEKLDITESSRFYYSIKEKEDMFDDLQCSEKLIAVKDIELSISLDYSDESSSSSFSSFSGSF